MSPLKTMRQPVTMGPTADTVPSDTLKLGLRIYGVNMAVSYILSCNL